MKYILLVFLFIQLSCLENDKNNIFINDNEKIKLTISNLLVNGTFSELKNNLLIFKNNDSILIFGNQQISFRQVKKLLETLNSSENCMKISPPLQKIQHLKNKSQNHYFLLENIEYLNCLPLDVKNKTGTKISFFKEESFEKSINEYFGYNPLSYYSTYVKKNGIFFQINQGFYMLIFRNIIYLITDKKPDPLNNIMFHIVDKNKEFRNFDFNFIQELNHDLKFDKELFITKLDVGDSLLDKTIRIGEYKNNEVITKNLWSQEIQMSYVFDNKLLKYSGEFNKKVK